MHFSLVLLTMLVALNSVTPSDAIIAADVDFVAVAADVDFIAVAGGVEVATTWFDRSLLIGFCFSFCSNSVNRKLD